MSMKRFLLQDRDQLARKCHLYIPMELVYEAEKWQVNIDDTCTEALRRKIHAARATLSFEVLNPSQR